MKYFPIVSNGFISLIDFPDNLARVFHVSGCKMNCHYCHNKELQIKQNLEETGVSPSEFKDILEKDRNNWIDSVVFTGGEPTEWYALYHFIYTAVDQFRKKVKIDTNGSNPDVLKTFIEYLDPLDGHMIAMDVKTSLNRYRSFTGFNEINKIEDSMDIIRDSGVRYEFRITIDPAEHTEEVFKDILPLFIEKDVIVLQPCITEKITRSHSEAAAKKLLPLAKDKNLKISIR